MCIGFEGCLFVVVVCFVVVVVILRHGLIQHSLALLTM